MVSLSSISKSLGVSSSLIRLPSKRNLFDRMNDEIDWIVGEITYRRLLIATPRIEGEALEECLKKIYGLTLTFCIGFLQFAHGCRHFNFEVNLTLKKSRDEDFLCQRLLYTYYCLDQRLEV